MTTIIENLHAMRAQLDAMIASAQADGSGDKVMALPKAGKAKAPKAEKAPRANAGMPTLHGAWTTAVLKAHGTESEEFKEFLAQRIESAKAGQLLYNEGHAKVKKGKKQVGDAMDEKEAAVGAHTVWVAHWRKEHTEEFEQFKSTWESANPKESRVASAKASQASSDAEGEEGEEGAKPAPKKRGAKKMADMTEEERALAKAKRAENKAKKLAAKAEAEDEEAESFTMAPASKAPSAAVGGGGSVPAPASAEADDELELEEEAEDALIPFTHKKVKYLRYGHLDEDGEGVWWEGGDLWLQKEDGSKGAYAGQIQASGKIDNSPAVMSAEPDIN